MLVRTRNIFQPTLHFTNDVSETQAQTDFPHIISLLVENLKGRIQVHLFLVHYFSTKLSCLHESTRKVKEQKHSYCNKYLFTINISSINKYHFQTIYKDNFVVSF